MPKNHPSPILGMPSKGGRGGRPHAPAPLQLAAPERPFRPAGDPADDAAKDAAETAAKGSAGGGAGPADDTLKEDYAFVEERFSPSFTSGLTPDEVRAEADWHRREEAGFPTDRPSAELYAEHYRIRHPGVAVPPMPPEGVRSGTLDPSTVVALGLIPLSRTAPAGEERYYEPALVHEGTIVTARDGGRYRVVYSDGKFLATPEGGSPSASPTPSIAPKVSGSPSPVASQAPSNSPTANDLAHARSSGRWQGAIWGILGGVAVGVGVTVLAVKFWPKPGRDRDDDRRLPERSNPRGGGTIESDTPILPYVVATTVLEEARGYLSEKGKDDLAAKLYRHERKIATQLAARAEEVYAANERFRKSILSEANGGNAGRDQLYVWMRHWLAAYLKENEPAAYAVLPKDFGNGVPAPGSDKPGARRR